MMFVLKIEKKKKSSKTYNNHERSRISSNCFNHPVNEQWNYNKFSTKNSFFISAIFSFLLIPGYATAFLGESFNTSDLGSLGIGELGNSSIITISEVYGNINSTGSIGTPIFVNGTFLCKNGTLPCANLTAVDTVHRVDKSSFHLNNNQRPASNFSCSELKNPDSKRLCENFTESKDGYSVRYLGPGEFFWEHDSFTVYILPPGEILFNDFIRIANAENVAIIGEADADGKYPTLRGSKTNSTMIEWINCQNCMLANVNIDPATENVHSAVLQVSGKNTEMEFRNIHAKHSRTGLLYASSAKKVTLENVGTSFDPQNRHTTPSILKSSAISLHNCSDIKAKNVWVYDVSLNSDMQYPHVIDILNPEEINFDGIYIGLANNLISIRDMAYIGLAFSDMEKYSRAGGSVVNALMKGLHLGVYTEGETREYVTVPKDWPDNRHILSLSERTGSPADNTKVTGQVIIEANDYIQLIANKPGVQKVSGEDLFYNLKVIFPGLISPTVNISTPSSPVQKQKGLKGDDDSGMSTGEIAGTAAGVVVGVIVFIVGGRTMYKNWGTIKAFFAAGAGLTTTFSYKKAAGDLESVMVPDDTVYNDLTFGE